MQTSKMHIFFNFVFRCHRKDAYLRYGADFKQDDGDDDEMGIYDTLKCFSLQKYDLNCLT